MQLTKFNPTNINLNTFLFHLYYELSEFPDSSILNFTSCNTVLNNKIIRYSFSLVYFIFSAETFATKLVINTALDLLIVDSKKV